MYNIRKTSLSALLGVILSLLLGIFTVVNAAHVFNQDLVKTYNSASLADAVSSLDNNYIFVMFYSERCPHCVRAFPHLEKLSQAYKGDKNIITIGAIDAVAEVEASKKYQIAYFPTFFLIKGPNTSDVSLYQGAADAKNFLDFIQNQIPLSRDIDGNPAPPYHYGPKEKEFVLSLSKLLKPVDAEKLKELHSQISSAISNPNDGVSSDTLAIILKIAKKFTDPPSNDTDPLTLLHKIKESTQSIVALDAEHKTVGDLKKWKNQMMIIFLADQIIDNLKNSSSFNSDSSKTHESSQQDASIVEEDL